MTAPVSSLNSSTVNWPLSDQNDNRPAQLPAELPPKDPADQVSISPEARNLLAFRTAQNVIDNPIAAAAVSDNPQVDQVATNIYAAQQQQRLVDAYTSAASSSDQSSDHSPLAIAAVSDNPDVDELATTAYAARTAQDIVDTYQQASQSAESQTAPKIDEQA